MQVFKATGRGAFGVHLIYSLTLVVQSYAKTNADMVEDLKARGVITSELVARTMKAIDRKNYCPNASAPYEDQPQYIGFKATMNAPHVDGYALELLKDHLVTGETALDIGSGSGYMTVLMAILLGEGGYVIGIEHIPELVKQANTTVKEHQSYLLNTHRVKFVTGDGRQGYKKQAPYNAIHIGASVPEVSRKILEQLKPGGRLVGPVGEGNDQYLTVFDKTPEGRIITRKLRGVRIDDETVKAGGKSARRSVVAAIARKPCPCRRERKSCKSKKKLKNAAKNKNKI